MSIKRQFTYNPDSKEDRKKMQPIFDSTTLKLSNKLSNPKNPIIYALMNILPVYDQQGYGSCVANSCAYSIAVQSKNRIQISRLFNYAISRIIDYVPLNYDIGTTISSACKALESYGCCPEQTFPHSNKPSDLPPLSAFKLSEPLNSFQFYSVPRNIPTIQQCLLNGTPVIFGIIVYESFLSSTVVRTGKVPMPNKLRERKLGGHCVCMVGYNDSNSTFMCANSWGSSWGLGGFFFLHYNYIRDATLSLDFTVIKIVAN